ncbi:MATE efflux family protein [Ceratobasidium sp. AG-Ba]|nr:MATE efflux family protein [Ceratobasidium sp. AG-Ba]
MENLDWTTALKEAKVLVGYAAPIICTMLLEYLFFVTSAAIIGRISTEKLACAALGEITSGVTGLSIIQGFISTLESVLPRAWASDNPTHFVLWTQRMLVLAAFLIIPIGTLWLNAKFLFLCLRQEPVVARYVALYLRYLVFMLSFYPFNRVIRRYFQAQGLMHVPSIVVVIVMPINVALNYLLVWGPEPIRLGFIGAPIATSLSMFLISCCYIAYIIFLASRTAWHPVSSKALTNQPKLIRLGLAGIGQTVASWRSGELTSLAASQFGPTTLAAQSILVISTTTAFMIHAALAITSAVCIGKLLGAGNAHGALVASRVAVALAVIEGLAMGIQRLIFMGLRTQLTYFFNNDPAVAKLVSGVVPLLALYQVSDGVSATAGGILRACGEISTGATTNLIGYYMLGIPLGILLAFKYHFGLFGLWIGIAIALLFAAVVPCTFILRLDWDAEVRDVKERIAPDEVHATSDEV